MGAVVVLDGVHRLPPGALVAAFSRLCTERELDLPDGTRLVDQSRCDGGNSLACGFRLVALAEPGSWLSPEIAALFSTHFLPELSSTEIGTILQHLIPAAAQKQCEDIAGIAAAAARTCSDPTFSEGERNSLRLSLRVLLRITRQAAGSNGRSLREIVHGAVMSRFLPVRLQEEVEGWLSPVEHARSAQETALKSYSSFLAFWLKLKLCRIMSG